YGYRARPAARPRSQPARARGYRSLFECLPAGVRRKASAEFVREPAQRRDDIVDTARAGVIERPAAERRITGTEDHRAVDNIGIVDNTFAQARDANVRHRQHQAVDHLVGDARTGLGQRALLRLTVFPAIEALAGLSAKLTLCNLLAQPGRCRRQQIPELRAQHVADVEADVEPDLVGELDRSHR